MRNEIPRRTFLGVGAAAIAAATLSGCSDRDDATSGDGGKRPIPAIDIPVIDAHIHLFDPSRPGGVPWPTASQPALYKTSLPARYRPLALPWGVVGAIEVECSELVEDNQWVLDVAAKDDIIVGTIGRLYPGTPEFRAQLERFHKNPLFRGIRTWLGTQGGKEFDRPEYVADLKALADADLVMDTANPTVALLEDVVRASDKVPNLRIVVDHLPQMEPPAPGAAERARYDACMKAIRGRPRIYVKVSEVLRRLPDNSIPTDAAFYRARIDEVFDVFGPDRVLFGSDWPNCDLWLSINEQFQVVREYFKSKGRATSEKYFWRNSVACYKWVKRTAAQAKLV